MSTQKKLNKKPGVKPGTKRGNYNKKPKTEIRKPVTKENIIDELKKKKPEINNEEKQPEENIIQEKEIEIEIQSEEKPEEEKEPEEKKPEGEVSNEGENQFSELQKENNIEYEDGEAEEEKDFEEEIKEKPEQEKQKLREEKVKEKETNAVMFNGAMLLSFCNMIFPGLVLWLMKKIQPKNKKLRHVGNAEVMLTDEQLDLLEDTGAPDEAAKIIFEYLHPLVIFAISMGSMFWNNAMIAAGNISDKKLNELEEKATEEKIKKEEKKK